MNFTPISESNLTNGLIIYFKKINNETMFSKITFILLVCSSAIAQYEDYESYQTFSDLDQNQRDYGLTLLSSFIYTDISESNSVTGQTFSDRKRNLLIYDFKMGYIFRGGFYFGLLYSGDTQDIDTTSPKTNRESLGLTFGIVRRGFSFMGSYMPYSRQSISGALDVTEYSKGSGFQLDFSYYFRLGRFLSIGPQLAYKSYQYNEAEDLTNFDSTANSKHRVLTPMLSLLINLYRG
jgi:hypothetical protein